MKKLLFFLFAISMSSVYARTWVVSNVPGFPADYDSIQNCINAASNGDIILLQGSGSNYGAVLLNKQLTIMGPGYFLNQNVETQANAAAAKIEYLNCVSGSMGSIIQGLEITGTHSISGCSDLYPVWFGQICDASIDIENTGVTLISNKIGGWTHIRNSNGTSVFKCYGGGVFCSNNISALSIENSIFLYGCYLHNANVKNCLFDADLSNNEAYGFSDCNVSNSILMPVSFFWDLSSTFNNNIFMSSDPLSINNGNNIPSIDPATLFVGYPVQSNYSDDGKFKLRNGSLAIGNGVGGVDIGPFGGPTPYRLSGISFHPNIWEVTMPTTGTSGGGLDIHVKVNAND